MGNPNGVLDEYTVFGNGITAKVNLLERSCSCQKFDLVKMSCEHVMAALRAKNAAILRTSCTDSNPDRKFYNCAIAKDNGACSFFKWLDELSPPSSPSTFILGLETSNFQGLVKFNLLQRLQQCEENKDFS
ncbi:hypothetical protein BC332_03764 [Capsicum chinense]|nr:hypothetical protein BC332_03764 [Capsicum chinense]